MAINLDFLNKNTLRKYPLRASTSGINNSGVTIPNWLIAALSLSVEAENRFAFVSNVVITDKAISITIRTIGTNTLIGYFYSDNLTNYSSVALTPLIPAASGLLTFGELSQTGTIIGSYALSEDAGAIEPSCIFPFTPPELKSISEGANSAVGHITILGDNIRIAREEQVLSLSVIDKTSILSNNDYHGQLANCRTPIVKSINTVKPSSLGNIDIFTIEPLNITVASGLITFDANLTPGDVCPAKNVITPPVNTSNDYYTDFESASGPEWLTWPNF